MLTESARVLTPLLSRLPGKAGRFFEGRRGWMRQLAQAPVRAGGIWIHAASAGEFEQARPLLEKIRGERPDLPVTVTFFSPSGYERFRDKIPARTLYLPLDTPGEARRFLDAVRPRAVLFVKYDFWPYFLQEIGRRNIPLFLVSGIFRPDQRLWRIPFLRESLRHFTRFFVQDEDSARLLRTRGLGPADVTGDTRFDSVAVLPSVPADFPVIRAFKRDAKLLVAGSTWPADEDMLLEVFARHAPSDWKLLIVPHEPTEAGVRRLLRKSPLPVARYTTFGPADRNARVLAADTVGLLKYVYRHGDLAYVGGGFGKGIHNTLEAAVYGLPVIFGPRHQKFNEARDLVRLGAGFPVSNGEEFARTFTRLRDERVRQDAGERAAAYVKKHTGAVEKIWRVLENYLT